MKKIILAAALLFATPVLAEKPATLVCAFQDGQTFTAVGTGSRTVIQWGDGSFYNATSSYVDPWLTITEATDNGNVFKMAFNVRTKDAYGITTFTNGTQRGGPLWCVFK
jgi:hypothetical protein